MSVRDTFLAEAAQRILITDGAFGTEIQNRKLGEADYAGGLGLGHDQKGNNMTRRFFAFNISRLNSSNLNLKLKISSLADSRTDTHFAAH